MHRLATVHARDDQRPTNDQPTNDQRRHDTAYLNKRLFYLRKVRRLKSNQWISLKLDLMIGLTNRRNWLTFGDDPVPDTDSGISITSTSLAIAEYGVLGNLFVFLIIYSRRPILTTVGELTDLTPITFWERSNRHPDTNLD